MEDRKIFSGAARQKMPFRLLATPFLFARSGSTGVFAPLRTSGFPFLDWALEATRTTNFPLRARHEAIVRRAPACSITPPRLPNEPVKATSRARRARIEVSMSR
jgi:hypothetical protein